jgi:sugar-specific transcriptional regulator TrmB
LDELFTLLTKLGASRKEAEVYLKAVDVGRVDVEEASSLLNLDRAGAQAFLEGMVAKGLLKPRGEVYEPSEPKTVAYSLLKIKVEEVNAQLQSLHGAASRLTTLLGQYYAERRMGVEPGELLKPLESLEAMEAQTVEMISSASSEVDIFTASFGWLDKVSEVLDAARSRGVKVRVLMKVVDDPSRKAAERLVEAGAEVRIQKEPWYPLRGTIVDGRRLVFLVWTTERKTKHYRPHYTENEGLLKVFKEAFEERWRKATPFKPVAERCLKPP